jgi:NAD(P)-dependent dehydrogenase (short-subunit alcohol dehydrogenase family)
MRHTRGLGEAEEIAGTVLFLASDDASNVQARKSSLMGGRDRFPGRRADRSRLVGTRKIMNPVSTI